MGVKQLWDVSYKYFQTMYFEGVRPLKQFMVVAGNEEEALAKGDQLFAAISKYHARLVGGEQKVYDNGDPYGYGLLSDLKKEAIVNEGKKIVLKPPQLDGICAKEFELETVIKNDGQEIKVTYVPKPKVGLG